MITPLMSYEITQTTSEATGNQLELTLIIHNKVHDPSSSRHRYRTTRLQGSMNNDKC